MSKHTALWLSVMSVVLLCGCLVSSGATASPAPTTTASPTTAASATAGPTPTAVPGSTMPPGLYGGGPEKPGAASIWHDTDTLTVYTTGRSLCSLRAGQQKPDFIADATWVHAVQVSDDGSLIAFVSETYTWTERERYESRPALWVARPDGSDLRQIFGSEQVSIPPERLASGDYGKFMEWRWLPGTRQIVLAGAYIDYPFIEPNNDLYRIDAETGQVVTLLKPGAGGGHISVSPDGRHIAVVRKLVRTGTDTITLIDGDGSNWQPDVFSYPIIYTYSERWAPAEPVWAPDSAGFWTAIPPHDPDYAGDRGMALWYVPADGGQAKVIARFDTVEKALISPVVSADGGYVSFYGMVDGQQGRHIFRVDTGEEVQAGIDGQTPTPDPISLLELTQADCGPG